MKRVSAQKIAIFILIGTLSVLPDLIVQAFPLTQISPRSKSSPQQIIVWHTFNLQQTEILRSALTEFERIEHVKVVLETGFPLTTALLKKKKNFNLPDALIAPSDVINIHPAVPFMNIEDSWILKDTESLDNNSKTRRGIPLILGNHLMLFYNKALVSEPVASWEELKAEAPKIIKANLLPIVFDFREPFFLMPFFVHFLPRNMATESAAQKTEALTEAMTRALSFYKSLAQEGVVPTDCSFTCVEQFFLAGKSPYAILGDWALLEMSSKLGASLGIRQLPSLGGMPVSSIRIPTTLSFPMSLRHMNLAPKLKALALFLQSKSVQQRLTSEGFRLVSNSSVRKRVTNQNDGLLAVVWDLYKKSKPLPGYIDALFWSAIGRALNLHVDGSLESSQAAELIFDLSKNQKHLEIYQ